MRRFRSWLSFAVLSSVAVAFASAAEPEKYALLVGVSKYDHAEMNRITLKYPEADATAVATFLKEAGYSGKTLFGEQATKTAIEEELKILSTKGNDEGVVLVGLFGHGVQYGDDAYFGPYDTAIRQAKDASDLPLYEKNGLPKQEPDPETMVSMKSILSALSLSGAGNRVLLADCCREDPAAARGRAFGARFDVADLPDRTAAIFACSQGEQAFEHDDWGHGAFTKALLDRLRSNELSRVTANSLSTDLFDSVKEMVQDKTDGRQSQSVHAILNGIVNLHIPVTSKMKSSDEDASVRPLFETIGDVLTRKDFVTNEVVGEGAWGTKYEDWPAEPAYLVGLKVTTMRFGNGYRYLAIGSVAPIYRTAKQDVVGKSYGPVKGRFTEAVAKPGYAVGRIEVNYGSRITGLRLVFMKIVGNRLDSEDSYSSDWIGVAATGRARTLGDESFIVGIGGQYAKETWAIRVHALKD